MAALIRLDAVHAGYRSPAGPIEAVHGVSLAIADDEILGIAGESGCGKSTLMKLLYGQYGARAHGPLHLFAGQVTAEIDGATIAGDALHDYWWDFISYIPQGSMSVLNPVLRIGDQAFDAIPPRHRARGGAALRAAFTAFAGEIGLEPGVLRAFPHQLSGGMRQRVLVAMAAFLQPRVILADEPTTALDVIMQKRILILLHQLQRRMHNALVIVSHDLGVHFQLTDRLAIAYAAEIVELGPTAAMFAAPLHPYTQALVEALPRIGESARREGLEGRPPGLNAPPSGCRFHPRCPIAQGRCAREAPVLEEKAAGRLVACHFR
jgi:peptide/nickel transport system ATP-binding protein